MNCSFSLSFHANPFTLGAFLCLALTVRAKRGLTLVKYDSFQLYLANNIVNNHGRLGFAYQYKCNMSAISEPQSRLMSSEVWIGI